jgi:hypothetical protein
MKPLFTRINNIFESFDDDDDDIAKGEKEIKKVFEDSKWLVVQPLTERAACFYGQGTNWDVSSQRSNNNFNDYNTEGPVCIAVNKKDHQKYGNGDHYDLQEIEKYMFHFFSWEFVDNKNNDIDYDKLPKISKNAEEYSIKMAIERISKEIGPVKLNGDEVRIKVRLQELPNEITDHLGKITDTSDIYSVLSEITTMFDGETISRVNKIVKKLVIVGNDNFEGDEAFKQKWISKFGDRTVGNKKYIKSLEIRQTNNFLKKYDSNIDALIDRETPQLDEFADNIQEEYDKIRAREYDSTIHDVLKMYISGEISEQQQVWIDYMFNIYDPDPDMTTDVYVCISLKWDEGVGILFAVASGDLTNITTSDSNFNIKPENIINIPYNIDTNSEQQEVEESTFNQELDTLLTKYENEYNI